MTSHNRSSARLATRFLTFVSLIFVVVLCFAGGASRMDAGGQPLVRVFAWLGVLSFILIGARPDWRAVRSVALFLGAAILLVAIQLVPLPPPLWSRLPGHELFTAAAAMLDRPQPWRPLTISPGLTVNALSSLVVPFVVLMIVATPGVAGEGHQATAILMVVAVGSLFALLQITGNRIDNPLLNEIPDSVSGNFANRNHFALFLALGMVVLPVWAFDDARRRGLRPIVGFLALPLLALILLATGSRAGLLVGIAGLVAGLVIVRPAIATRLARLPRRYVFGVLGAQIALLAAAVGAAIVFGQALAIDRSVTLDATDDLRATAAPVIAAAVGGYLPFGSGFGTFDTAYRIIEPDRLLMSKYLNHAHNDWLEIALEGGVFALALALGFLVWLIRAIIRIWHIRHRARYGAAGCVMLVLIAVASLTDYPARTPLIMAIAVVAAVWVAMALQNTRPERTMRRDRARPDETSLPDTPRNL